MNRLSPNQAFQINLLAKIMILSNCLLLSMLVELKTQTRAYEVNIKTTIKEVIEVYVTFQ